MDSNPRSFAQSPTFLRVLHPRLQPICTPIVHRLHPCFNGILQSELVQAGLSAAIDPWAFSPRVKGRLERFCGSHDPEEGEEDSIMATFALAQPDSATARMKVLDASD